MRVTFAAQLIRGTQKDTMGFEVPPEVIEALGRGKRPPVIVHIRDHSYPSTVAVMGGKCLIGVAKEHRAPAGVADEVELDVTLELDESPRTVELPDDLASALEAANVVEGFARLAPSRRKELVRQIEGAKARETRARRVERAVEAAKERA